jgi:hypothetical protein
LYGPLLSTTRPDFLRRHFAPALIAEGIPGERDAVDIDDFLTKPDLTGRAGARLACVAAAAVYR